MTEKEYSTGGWKPMEDKYNDDRFMITHTGYLVDTELDEVYLTIQAFLNFVNKEIGVKLSDNEKKYYHDSEYYKRRTKQLEAINDDWYKENERLREQNQYLKSDKFIQDYIKEVDYRISQQHSLEAQNNKLVKENKRLEQQLEDCRFAHRTEMAHHRVVEKEFKQKLAKRDNTSQNLYEEDI